MKNIFVTLILILVLLITSPQTFAHPGGTDANGGHVCRTNCDSWGYEYGEYHTHGNSSSSASEASKTTSDYSGIIIIGLIALVIILLVKKKNWKLKLINTVCFWG